jgi:enterochelin esterase-like enzyme
MNKKLTMTLLMLLALSGCGGGSSASSSDNHLIASSSASVHLTGCGEVAVGGLSEGGACPVSLFAKSPIGGNADYASVTADCDQKGTIESLSYSTHSYALEALNSRNDLAMTKKANVYLPYGYLPSEKYDVLYLLHGAGENQDFWFAQGSYDPANTTTYLRGYATTAVLDNLIAKGLSKKMIVVTPCLYSAIDGLDSSQADFTSYFYEELMKDLVPAVVAKYSTYAASSSEADLLAARDHMAYAGLSMGSKTSFNSIFLHALPYFAYLGSYSAGTSEDVGKAIVEKMTSGDYRDYTPKYWFNGCGSIDGLLAGHIATYTQLVQGVSSFKPGSSISSGANCDMMVCEGTGHTYACWLTCLYNSLLVFFKA